MNECRKIVHVITILAILSISIGQAKTISEIIESIEKKTNGAWSLVKWEIDPSTHQPVYIFNAERPDYSSLLLSESPKTEIVSVKVPDIEKLEADISKYGPPSPLSENQIQPQDPKDKPSMLAGMIKNDGQPYFFMSLENAKATAMGNNLGLQVDVDHTNSSGRPKYLFFLVEGAGETKVKKTLIFSTERPSFVYDLIARFERPIFPSPHSVKSVEDGIVFPDYEGKLAKEIANRIGFRAEYIEATLTSPSRYKFTDYETGFSFSIKAEVPSLSFNPEVFELFRHIDKVGVSTFRKIENIKKYTCSKFYN